MSISGLFLAVVRPIRSSARVLALTLLAAVFMIGSGIVPATTAAADGRHGPRRPAVIDGAVVVEWSRITFDTVFADDQYVSFKGPRHQAMVHIAMHDALNAIDARYEQYAYLGRSRHADPIAAAAKAAHDVLVAVYPTQRQRLDAELAGWLGRVPNGRAKARALALGAASARAIVELRAGDGTEVDLESSDYVPGDQPGDYQFVPPYGFTLAKDFQFATPFALTSAKQFRVPPPPALRGRTYARAYNEISSVGAKDSTTRTADQSAYANWWYESSEIGWARIARVTATSQHLDLWRAARMFALVSMSFYDGYLAGWDSKFHYDFWRPYTAIRAGSSDGNRRTVGDPTWESYLETPPVQDYPSTHSVLGAGAAEVLMLTFGTDRLRFTMDSTTALPESPIRSFRSFTQAADQNADSRVRAGIHFRFSTERGQQLGRQVGRYIVEHELRPR